MDCPTKRACENVNQFKKEEGDQCWWDEIERDCQEKSEHPPEGGDAKYGASVATDKCEFCVVANTG
jgi:hypothetical protein